MNLDLSFLPDALLESTVPIPVSGTLSGHAAGEPFDKHVFEVIKKHYPTETYRQFELLNKLYGDNATALSYEDRVALVTSPALSFLLSRGREATSNWNDASKFEEKQNDTADIIVAHEDFFNIIDVKTFNTSKNGQPPNIISAYKLAKMCALMLQSRVFDSHDITYVAISWQIDGRNLKCVSVAVKELFKTNPQALYINWAAALQVQFHVDRLSQEFEGDVEEWCKKFLERFTSQAETRITTMRRKFVDPFVGLIE